MIDLIARNDDWLRTRTWDLWTANYEKPVMTLSEMLIFLDVTDLTSNEQRVALQKFMFLPSAEPMPQELRTEIEKYLGGDSDLAGSIANALIAKFNPNHDNLGRFASSPGGPAVLISPKKLSSGTVIGDRNSIDAWAKESAFQQDLYHVSRVSDTILSKGFLLPKDLPYSAVRSTLEYDGISFSIDPTYLGSDVVQELRGSTGATLTVRINVTPDQVADMTKPDSKLKKQLRQWDKDVDNRPLTEGYKPFADWFGYKAIRDWDEVQVFDPRVIGIIQNASFGQKFNPYHDEAGRFAESPGGPARFFSVSKYPTDYKDTTEEQKMNQAKYSDIKANMKQELDRIRGSEPTLKSISGEITTKSVADITDNVREEIGSFSDYLAGDTTNMLHAYISRWERDTTKNVNELKGIDAGDLDSMMRDHARKLVMQEVESNRQQFTDHGIRHILGNLETQNRIMDVLEIEGYKIGAREHLLADFIAINHDVGYTTPVIRDGGKRAIDASKDHKRFSEKIASEQQEIWNEGKIFTPDEYKRALHIIRTHDDTSLDVKDPIALTVRISDNTSMFRRNKLPSMFAYVSEGHELLTRMQEATKVDDKASFDISRIALQKAVNRSNLNEPLKRDLRSAIGEINWYTPKFTIGTLAGRVESLDSTDRSLLRMRVRYNDFDDFLSSSFDMGQRQTRKLLSDYGVTDFTKSRYDLGKTNGKSIFTLEIEL